MKRADIKKRPMTATTLDSLEPEEKAYNELDEPNPCGALYFSVKPSGSSSLLKFAAMITSTASGSSGRARLLPV